jgi:hypothetical protein
MPTRITSAANAIKSHKEPRLAGGAETAAGVLGVSEDVLAVASGAAAAAAGVLAVSERVLAVIAGLVVTAAGVADGFP